MLFERRSLTASPRAVLTSGSPVFSPLGVFTGSFGSNGFANGLDVAPVAWSTKRRNSTAPGLSRLSVLLYFASTGHAALTSTGPPPVDGSVPSSWHIFTSWSRHRTPAYWRSFQSIHWRSPREKPLPFRPSWPWRRRSIIVSPLRVRSERAVSVSPMILANPV